MPDDFNEQQLLGAMLLAGIAGRFGAMLLAGIAGIAADLTVCLHLGYVLFIVLGQVGVMAGAVRGWKWVRHTKFRLLHLIGILIVVAESWLGMTCPLTTLENHLRRESGGAAYEGDFIASCVHDTLYFECAPWAFTTIYSLFGLAVVVTLIVCPPGSTRAEPSSSATDSPAIR